MSEENVKIREDFSKAMAAFNELKANYEELQAGATA